MRSLHKRLDAIQTTHKRNALIVGGRVELDLLALAEGREISVIVSRQAAQDAIAILSAAGALSAERTQAPCSN